MRKSPEHRHYQIFKKYLNHRCFLIGEVSERGPALCLLFKIWEDHLQTLHIRAE